MCIDPAPTAAYASSVGTTSLYDCRLNEYYQNECSLFLKTQHQPLVDHLDVLFEDVDDTNPVTAADI